MALLYLHEFEVRMIVGFTGTSHGLTTAQRRELDLWLARLRLFTEDRELHHGCCVGADATAHCLARDLGYRIVGYPAFPVGHASRADLPPEQFARLRVMTAPLTRNKQIVEVADVLLVCPQQRAEQRRSGTWATFRYAAARSLSTILIYP